jgi:hypothetical protein
MDIYYWICEKHQDLQIKVAGSAGFEFPMKQNGRSVSFGPLSILVVNVLKTDMYWP